MSFLILGCGYTGKLVAESLAAQGLEVTCTNHLRGGIPGVRCLELDVTNPESITALTASILPGTRILYSVPGLAPSNRLISALRSWQPQRMVYLSSTGVYGPSEYVDETTPPLAQDEKAAVRLITERLLADGPWPTLVLRPAAIYGPDRGIHISVLQDDYERARSWNRLVSRIHVNDLAAHVEAALRSDREGQFPVADTEACRSTQVAEFAARLLGKTIPERILSGLESDGGRRVNGSAIRKHLGLALRYPTYREGITAAFQDFVRHR